MHECHWLRLVKRRPQSGQVHRSVSTTVNIIGRDRRGESAASFVGVNGPATTLLVAAGLAAVTNWWAVGTGRRKLERINKPLTMVLLIGAALALDPATPQVRAWFVAALLFSLAGDVFLMLERERFVLGLASFLVAHLAYTVGLVVPGPTLVAALVGVGAAVGGIMLVGRRIQRAAARSDPSLASPVLAYMVVISMMLAAAIATTNLPAILGACFFYASDGILGWNRFVAPIRGGRVMIMATYHLAQALLVVALVSF